MGESNGDWGSLAVDDDLAELWDGFQRLPEPGENPALDAFVERKHITIASLVRLGSRLANHDVLAFALPGGVKYRNIVTDARWSYHGSEFKALKIVQHGPETSSTVIVAEGETDGAWLSDRCHVDVAILPAGADARPHAAAYAAQLAGYDLVLLGHDDDDAGNAGAAQLLELLPQAVRFVPPGGDWCDTDELPPLPDPVPSVTMKVLVPAGELLDLEPPHLISWFERGLLPVGGLLILHGWAKSFKSFLALDLLSALSQGQPWAGFEPSEEACRVAVMQYEIPWGYYQQRLKLLRSNAAAPELFDTNFLSYKPLIRPTFIAGNKAQEDVILRELESADVQVFLLDPVRRATGNANLNQDNEVQPLLAFFARLQDAGVTVIACHHDNKESARSGGGDPLGMTGAGSFTGNPDTIISVAVPKGSGLETPKRNLHFTLRNAPAPSPVGMVMSDLGCIEYSSEPYGIGLADDSSAPGV